MVESISMDELDGLAVHGETTVGWDENTPPNETVDEDGQPFPIDSGFGQPDPRSSIDIDSTMSSPVILEPARRMKAHG